LVQVLPWQGLAPWRHLARLLSLARGHRHVLLQQVRPQRPQPALEHATQAAQAAARPPQRLQQQPAANKGGQPVQQ
jgi:hypothetical protein